MTDFPPLPKIEGDFDLFLDVFTHKSIKQSQQPNIEYGDTDRLAEIGGKILDLVVTNHFYSKRPMLSATEITGHTQQSLSDDNILLWLNAYGLKGKYRYLPNERELVESPGEMRRFFNTYIGALHIRAGINVIQDWISRLIDPEGIPPGPTFGNEPSEGSTSSGTMASPTPPPPTAIPPPLPSGQPPPPQYAPPGHSGGPSGLSSAHITLALVNQTASQKGISVQYSAEQAGPSHMPTWTVRCFMNGVEQGRGVGKSQKIAKEEAARQAWARMGW